MPMLKVCIIPQ